MLCFWRVKTLSSKFLASFDYLYGPGDSSLKVLRTKWTIFGCCRKKKSTGSIGGQNSKNTPNTSLYATGKSSGDHRTKLKESHDTTAAIQLLSRENGGGGGGGGGQNYKKSSIKSASSSTNNTPTVKRRKSSKRSGKIESYGSLSYFPLIVLGHDLTPLL